MAKRKRLTLPASPPPDPGAPGATAPLETKALFGPGGATLPPGAAPIARIAVDAATAAALEEVSAELIAARREGRLIQWLALDAVAEGHLVRDRLSLDPEEMAVLRESLRARGQQTPIEVVALGDGRFGLISGLRRLTALRELHAETGEPRFGRVLAFLRQPADAAAPYVAMVEENEIRVGLSHYERAHIVARTTAQGIFPDRRTALATLFASASRAKRSKVGAFLVLVDALGEALRHPQRIGERLGLGLAQALEADPGLGPRLCARLAALQDDDPEAEAALLAAAAEGKLAPDPAGAAGAGRSRPGAAPARPPAALDKPVGAEEPAPGVYLETGGGALRPRFTLSGPRVDSAFRARLVAWLRDQGT